MTNKDKFGTGCTKMLAAAKSLEDAAYTMAGEVDTEIVAKLISLSAEVSRIEAKVFAKGGTTGYHH